MDIFDVLTAVSERKKTLIQCGMNEYDALKNAVSDIAVEYNISLPDVKKLAG